MTKTTSPCSCCKKTNQFCRCTREVCGKCHQCSVHCECFNPTFSPTLDSVREPEGDRGICRAPECRAVIWWQVTAKGKRTPVNADGSPHWADCPAAKSFSKRRTK
jgi:hypothetical protein